MSSMSPEQRCDREGKSFTVANLDNSDVKVRPCARGKKTLEREGPRGGENVKLSEKGDCRPVHHVAPTVRKKKSLLEKTHDAKEKGGN